MNEQKVREIVREEIAKREAAALVPAAMIQQQMLMVEARIELAKKTIQDPLKLQEILNILEGILCSYSQLFEPT